jgi:hypothetical protein
MHHYARQRWPVNRSLRAYGSGTDAGRHGAMNPAGMLMHRTRRKPLRWLGG